MKKDLENEQDLADLITKLQEQITILEKKVDILISRSLPKPVEVKPVSQTFTKPFQPPVNTYIQDRGKQDSRFQTEERQYNRFQTGGRQDNRFQGRNRQDDRFRERIMHKATCADCKRECEVPFRPVEGRPIYCQGCFSHRKSTSPFKANFDNRSRETAPTQVTNFDKLQGGGKKRPDRKGSPSKIKSRFPKREKAGNKKRFRK